MKKTICLFLGAFFLFSTGVQAKGESKKGKKRPTGLIMDDPFYGKTQKKATFTREMYVLPESYSLKEYAPVPGDQGQLSTCTGWATGYTARSIIEALQGKEKKSFNFSPGFIYRSIQSDLSCSLGSSMEKALSLMMNKGVVPLDYLEEQCPKAIPANLYQVSENFKIKGYNRLFDLFEKNEVKIRNTKKSISENKPVVVGMICCSKSFEESGEIWRPDDNFTDSALGGHALTVIGYDDNKAGGAFEVQNSWGRKWGKDGYVWIPYDVFGQVVRYGYELLENPKTEKEDDPVLAYDLAGSIRLKLNNGGEMGVMLKGDHYLVKEAYPSGTQFRIFLNNFRPANVYVIGSDLTNEVYRLFPHRDDISPYLNYRENEIALPDEKHYIQTDEKAGTDFICIIYAKEPLDLPKVMAEIKRAEGSFAEKINRVFGSKLVENRDILFEPEKISFRANSQGKEIVTVLIEKIHE